jgi:hypothetical protein
MRRFWIRKPRCECLFCKQFQRFFSTMLSTFDFCLPTKATTVPDTPDRLHEVKYDGYRLRLERDGDRVRLIERGGYDWTKRFPWIVDAALKNRQKHFVIDGEYPISSRGLSALLAVGAASTSDRTSRRPGWASANSVRRQPHHHLRRSSIGTLSKGFGITRRATKNPTILASGTRSLIKSFIARKCDPVVRTSSTMPIFVGTPARKRCSSNR